MTAPTTQLRRRSGTQTCTGELCSLSDVTTGLTGRPQGSSPWQALGRGIPPCPECESESNVNVDLDTVIEYAERALERPSDAAFWDERCYETHVPVISWADRGDDILEESNFHTARDLIAGAAEDEEHWFQGSAGHWLVGNLEQIWVQVYEDETREEFTQAFIEAVEIQESLSSYPILDESDYSEREWKLYEENLSEALDQAQRDYDLDTGEEAQAIRDAFYEVSGERLPWDGADVSWDAVEELYREVRDEFFTELVLGVHPGQLQLDLSA
ncbi:hypothetical protein SEA_VERSE_74 [Streptomyces phage Verse]|uniref:Uncharacterized protein n=1 Tax=Streptomyces phage Verse TaxID=1673878 RepID=A0A0K1YAI3_9CAUD|nr:hypothetical protein SEA_VERSE_74 [Streptomyces phage Verse]